MPRAWQSDSGTTPTTFGPTGRRTGAGHPHGARTSALPATRVGRRRFSARSTGSTWTDVAWSALDAGAENANAAPWFPAAVPAAGDRIAAPSAVVPARPVPAVPMSATVPVIRVGVGDSGSKSDRTGGEASGDCDCGEDLCGFH